MVCFLGLGSNLGDKEGNLVRAVELLAKSGLEVLAVSSVFATEPVDNPNQPWFVNQVISVATSLECGALLRLAKSVERDMKRVPRPDKGPRTIDIDILLCGDTVLDTPELVIPHPRLALRNFVLVPMAEIAAEVRHPVLGRTVRELAAACPDRSRVTALPRRPGPR